MARILDISRHFALVIISALLAVSCSLVFDNFKDADEEDNSCFVSLTISSAGSTTRAEHNDANGEGLYDDGTDTAFENTIDIEGGDYRLYLFDNTNHYITQLSSENLIYLRPEVNENTHVYRLLGRIDASSLDENAGYKAVFICNRKGNYRTSLTSSTTIADLQSTYTYSSEWTLGASNLIPMFGVTNELHTHVNVGGLTDLGSINLLRAMVKMEIKAVDGETEDIEYVEIERYNTSGTYNPGGVTLESQYFRGNYIYDDDFIKTPTLPRGFNTPATTESAEYIPRRFGCLPGVGTEKSSFLAYMPEYKNIGAEDATRLKIKFKEDPDDCFFYLEFKSVQENNPYQGYHKGDPYDLLRNTYYKFTVRRNSFGIDAVVEVIPYSEVVLDPEFGFDDFVPPPSM